MVKYLPDEKLYPINNFSTYHPKKGNRIKILRHYSNLVSSNNICSFRIFMLTSESLPYLDLDLRNAYFDLAYTCTSLLNFFYKNKTQNFQQMKCHVIHEKSKLCLTFPMMTIK